VFFAQINLSGIFTETHRKRRKKMLPALQCHATSNGTDLHTEATFEVINPATGKAFAQAPSVTPKQLDAVFASADLAFQTWRRDDGFRQTVLLAAADAIESSMVELSHLLTTEQGKPLLEAKAEITSSLRWLRYYATLQLQREILQDDDKGFAQIFRRPHGVVSAITPWNFPVTLAILKIAPALRAGNTVVLKPSPFTPLTTLALGKLLRGVLPAGVFNVVSGPDPLGSSLTSHPVPRKISFTGSTATGKKVALTAAEDLKRVTLELGGNDPAVVLEGADVSKIADSLFWGAFRNNGQICIAIKRIYAHESVYNDLVEALSAIAKSVKVGEGTLEDVRLGPINNKPQLGRIIELVDDAIANGARLAAGGKQMDRPGYFFEPTILAEISDGVRIVDEEQFGPALPVVPFRNESDAITRANHSHYGLTASVWSDDLERATRLATEIDAGQVSINVHGGAVAPALPFSGHKWSGIGVESGPWGLNEFTDLQVIWLPSRKLKA
jgi:acyl-CoA reductase-like NAD-dependent aldehyde dehydrogenase